MIVNEINDDHGMGVMLKEAKFGMGQLIKHRLFDYRGVIVDIDPIFMGTENWYQEVAKTRPPKNKPWYKILVNNSLDETYVAEQNLQGDDSLDTINHPLVGAYFDKFENGIYINNSWRTN
jgi:heat shock protein HspQ